MLAQAIKARPAGGTRVPTDDTGFARVRQPIKTLPPPPNRHPEVGGLVRHPPDEPRHARNLP